jgi:hypothetical protein
MEGVYFYIRDSSKKGENYTISNLAAQAVRDENGHLQVLEDYSAYIGENETKKISFCECSWNNDFSSCRYTSEEYLINCDKFEKVGLEEFIAIRERILAMTDEIVKNYLQIANDAKIFIQQHDNFMGMVRQKLVSIQGKETKGYDVLTTLHDFYYSDKGEEGSFRINYVKLNTFDEATTFYTDSPSIIDKNTYIDNAKEMYSQCRDVIFPNYSQTKSLESAGTVPKAKYKTF